VKDALMVALGGALGSVLRWAVVSGVARLPRAAGFPWGTLGVNLAGSCAIGFVLTLAFERGLVAPGMRLFLVTGVLGGFTTFSAFSWETLVLVRDGHTLAASGYVAGSVLGGLAAAVLGSSLAGRLGLTIASLAG
jgi:CrcB protein